MSEEDKNRTLSRKINKKMQLNPKGEPYLFQNPNYMGPTLGKNT